MAKEVSTMKRNQYDIDRVSICCIRRYLKLKETKNGCFSIFTIHLMQKFGQRTQSPIQSTSFFNPGEKLQGEVAFFYIFQTRKRLLRTKSVRRVTILGALQQRCRSGKRAQTTAY